MKNDKIPEKMTAQELYMIRRALHTAIHNQTELSGLRIIKLLARYEWLEQQAQDKGTGAS